MREREAKALELQRRQPVGETDDEQCKNEESTIAKPTLVNIVADSFTERKKKLMETENISTLSKIELFESKQVVPAPKSPSSTYFPNNGAENECHHRKLLEEQKAHQCIGHESSQQHESKNAAKQSQLLDQKQRGKYQQHRVEKLRADYGKWRRQDATTAACKLSRECRFLFSKWWDHYDFVYLSLHHHMSLSLVPRAAMSYCGSEIVNRKSTRLTASIRARRSQRGLSDVVAWQ
jgi:hypothetical protein